MNVEFEGNREAWNEAVRRHGGSLLQSYEWGELQETLGRRIHRFADGAFFASVVEYLLPLGRRYWYAPHGPVFVGEPRAVSSGKLRHELATNAPQGTIFLKIEPLLPATPENAAMLHAAGFRKVKDTQPSETLLIDLTKPEEALLREMEHDTRYAIRAAARRGVTVSVARTEEEKMSAFKRFWELFEVTNTRHELRAYPRAYYEAVTKLHGDLPAQAGCFTEIFLASLEGRPIAAAIIAYFGKRAYYLYAASRAGLGKFNAPSLILWEAIRRTRTRGYETFDLWGVSDVNPRWRGVTAFKRSFGGKEVKMVGTWEYPFQPLWYWGYNIAKKIV